MSESTNNSILLSIYRGVDRSQKRMGWVGRKVFLINGIGTTESPQPKECTLSSPHKWKPKMNQKLNGSTMTLRKKYRYKS